VLSGCGKKLFSFSTETGLSCPFSTVVSMMNSHISCIYLLVSGYYIVYKHNCGAGQINLAGLYTIMRCCVMCGAKMCMCQSMANTTAIFPVCQPTGCLVSDM